MFVCKGGLRATYPDILLTSSQSGILEGVLSKSPIASSLVCISVHCCFDFSANCHIETALSRITSAAYKFHWVLATSLFLLMHFDFDTTDPRSFLETPLLVSVNTFSMFSFSPLPAV